MDKNKSVNSKKIAKRVKELVNANQLVSCSEICKEFKCSYQTVYNVALRDGISIPKHNQRIKEALLESTVIEEQPKKTAKAATINNKYANSFNIEKRTEFWSKTDKSEVNVIEVPEKKEVKIIEEKKSATSVHKVEKEVPSETICGEPVYEFSSEIKPYVFAGLISQRHEMIDNNTKLFIYSGPIRSEHVHDYKRYNELADKFIKENVLSKGFSKLKVAVTGLTPAVAAVIKSSYENNISLSLMHFDNLTGKYQEQIITGSDAVEGDLSLVQVYAASMAKKNYKIKLVSFPAKDYSEMKSLYTVKIENLSNRNENPIVYITFDMNTMFNIYRELVQKVMTVKFESFRIGADEIAFGCTNREYSIINSFGSYYNMPKSNN